MVDMFIEHEQTKSLAYMAAMRLAEEYNGESRKALSALKVQVGKGVPSLAKTRFSSRRHGYDRRAQYQSLL